MKPNRPLLLTPVFRSYLWGGHRLQQNLGKNVPNDGIWAESWEVVDHGLDQSVVAEGAWAGWSLRKLIEAFPQEILGQSTPFNSFPLLLKYLDCQRVLSVQVHPNDAYGAKMHPPDLGKTEAWYVLDANPGSVIYAGLKPNVDRRALSAAIESGQTESCLHQIHPAIGDCVFIPAGTVHALGEGLLVVEIQQASDTTFRLFDWNRVGDDGKPRALHIDQALDVINYNAGPVTVESIVNGETSLIRHLVKCDKFFLDELSADSKFDFPLDNRFRIVTIPKGTATIRCEEQSLNLRTGDTILVPAESISCQLQVSQNSVALIAGLPD